MKNRSKLVLIVSLVCIPSVSQADSAPTDIGQRGLGTVHVGGLLGINLANWAGQDATSENSDYANRPGFAIGASANFWLHEIIGVQVEFFYTTKGSRVEANGVLSNTINFSYLEIPILARASLPLDAPVHPYLLIGPELGLTLVAEVEDLDGTIDDWKSMVKPYDIGLVAGMGVAWAFLPHWSLAFDARYDLGLTSIDDTGQDADITNRAFFFMLSVFRTDLGV